MFLSLRFIIDDHHSSCRKAQPPPPTPYPFGGRSRPSSPPDVSPPPPVAAPTSTSLPLPLRCFRSGRSPPSDTAPRPAPPAHDGARQPHGTVACCLRPCFVASSCRPRSWCAPWLALVVNLLGAPPLPLQHSRIRSGGGLAGGLPRWRRFTASSSPRWCLYSATGPGVDRQHR